jgi:hypothetical protein
MQCKCKCKCKCIGYEDEQSGCDVEGMVLVGWRRDMKRRYGSETSTSWGEYLTLAPVWCWCWCWRWCWCGSLLVARLVARYSLLVKARIAARYGSPLATADAQCYANTDACGALQQRAGWHAMRVGRLRLARRRSQVSH